MLLPDFGVICGVGRGSLREKEVSIDDVDAHSL